MVPGHAQQVGGGAELGRAEPFNQRGQVHGHPHVLHTGPAEDRHEGSWPPSSTGPALQEGNGCFLHFTVKYWNVSISKRCETQSGD